MTKYVIQNKDMSYRGFDYTYKIEYDDSKEKIRTEFEVKNNNSDVDVRVGDTLLKRKLDSNFVEKLKNRDMYESIFSSDKIENFNWEKYGKKKVEEYENVLDEIIEKCKDSDRKVEKVSLSRFTKQEEIRPKYTVEEEDHTHKRRKGKYKGFKYSIELGPGSSGGTYHIGFFITSSPSGINRPDKPRGGIISEEYLTEEKAEEKLDHAEEEMKKHIDEMLEKHEEIKRKTED